MVAMLAGGDHPVVARLTVAGNAGMVKAGDVPCGRHMTDITLTVGLQMVSMLAGGLDAVMTG